MSGIVQTVLGEVQACTHTHKGHFKGHFHVERAAVAWVSRQVAAYMPGWLSVCAPVPDQCWQVLKVRPMGERDSYHWLFGRDRPEEHEIRLVVFSNCGNALYRLDVVSFDADRLGAQIHVVPMSTYCGEALLT